MAVNQYLALIWDEHNFRIAESPTKYDKLIIRYNCQHCNEENVVEVDKKKFVDWSVNNRYLQDVWPELTGKEREEITHCIHAKCSDTFYESMGID